MVYLMHIPAWISPSSQLLFLTLVLSGQANPKHSEKVTVSLSVNIQKKALRVLAIYFLWDIALNTMFLVPLPSFLNHNKVWSGHDEMW